MLESASNSYYDLVNKLGFLVEKEKINLVIFWFLWNGRKIILWYERKDYSFSM